MSSLWVPQGPRPNTQGQVEGILDKEVVGAVKAIAAHPTDPNIVYIGAVNAGIWRTKNATAAKPAWEQLTDAERSLSSGTLQFDPTDHTHQTLVAGTGRFSSISRMGGALIGVLRTTDGGATWTTLDNGGLFKSIHICGVAPRGKTIVIAANNAGVFRTTNTGTAWMQISGAPGTGLPAGISFALAGDPTKRTRLFAHVGASGIYRSTNTGATWTKVSNAAIDSLLGSNTNNVKISVGHNNNVYVAIANSGRLAGLFRSGNGGGTWTPLDLPSTIEAGGVLFGLHPGRQASIHLSLVADRGNKNVVYIGGDRQPGSDEAVATAPRWPNSVGATDFSGRIFRVDSRRPSGSQATHLTHSNTASRSAPHADSRDMAIDANGDLLESDDGGIYRRTAPLKNTGDWFSMNGDLQATEFHSIAWDANSNIIIGGAQDTGSPQQRAPSSATWVSVSTADGDVAVADDTSTPGHSTRYSSFQFLGGFRREVYNSTNSLLSRTRVSLRVISGTPLVPQFYTPLELNQVTPIRLVVGAANSVYESDDQGDTVTEIGPGLVVNSALPTTFASPIAYGAQGNADLLYVGSGNDVFIRTAAHPSPLVRSIAYPRTGSVVGIAVPLADPNTAFVIEATKVYRTPNAGGHWDDITNNLLALGGVVLHSVVFCPNLNGGSVVVGTNAGVFAASSPTFSWSKIGSGLPTVPVFRLKYSATDRVLLAGTLGRGAWTLTIP